MEPFFLPT
jgi:hypothetical protein